jgi:hypothetical protein
MALWGNNDAIGSGGTVSLNYSTGVVTGSGTTFGQVGAAAIGDVIRFGNRAGVYFGDAVIVGIANTVQLTIGSTAGLSGASIAGTDFSISQLPKYTVLDSHYSETQGNGDLITLAVSSASTTAGVGTNIISLSDDLTTLANSIKIDTDRVSYAGTTTTFTITALTSSSVTLGSTISVGINTGDLITFSGTRGSYDSYVYGVDKQGIEAASGTQYEAGVGWVGVTTYNDNQGNLRVKKEILVSASGITTGNTPLYDGNPLE